MVALRVRVYVEGGGNTRGEQRELKEGFSKLFARALGDRAKAQVIACGSRVNAFDEFKRGLRSNPDALCILLVDSEGPVRDGASTWDHVRERKGDGWAQPEGTRDHQLHLMVQAMEAWLITDPDTLERYYGQGFKRAALPAQTDVERITKNDLFDSLERATRDSKTKKAYRKSHAFELIGLIDPAKVRDSWHAARFFDTLADHLPEPGSVARPPRR